VNERLADMNERMRAKRYANPDMLANMNERMRAKRYANPDMYQQDATYDRSIAPSFVLVRTYVHIRTYVRTYSYVRTYCTRVPLRLADFSMTSRKIRYCSPDKFFGVQEYVL